MKILIHLILILGLVLGNLKADYVTNECMTDIWFGNGVWNSKPQALESKEKISSLILRSIYAGDTSRMQQKHDKEIHLAYNWGKGPMADVLETYYQLKKAGQFKDVGFFTSIALLISDTLDAATKAAYELAFNVAIEEREAANAEKMWDDYYNESLRQSHRVLLISHSQGNLFANRLYEDFVAPSGYGGYFANLQVASPADHVGADLGKYVTISIDPVINPIPESLKPNANGNPGHGFVEAYLGQPDPLDQIIENTKLLLSQLDAAPSQWKPTELVSQCLTGKVVDFKHLFNSSLPMLEHVYYEKAGKIHPNGNLFISGICECCQDANSSEITAKEGFITVGINWNSFGIDMDLEFEAGIKDIDDIDGLLQEHYYVPEESDIGTGYFGIYVTHENSGDEELDCLSKSPMTLLLNVEKPGGNELFAMDIASEEALDLGHVADLYIAEDRQPKMMMSSSGSSRIGSSGQESMPSVFIPIGIQVAGSRPTKIYELIPRLDQALFGPLGGAKIGLYHAQEYHQNPQPLYAGSTTYGGSNITTGLLPIPKALKEGLEDNATYVIEITGGEDIDADDNLEIDEEPTLNQGSSHAVVTGLQIKERGFKVNILTEMAYQLTKELLQNGSSPTKIKKRLDEVAQRLIKEDVNDDNVINYNDLLKWTPYFDKSKLVFDYDQDIAPIVEKIYANEAIYEDVYRLVYRTFKVDSLKFEEGDIENKFTITFNDSVDQALIDSVTFTFKDEAGEEMGREMTIEDGKIIITIPDNLEELRQYRLKLVADGTDANGEHYHDELVRDFIIPDTTPPVFTIAERLTASEKDRFSAIVAASDNSNKILHTLIGGDDRGYFSLTQEGMLTAKTLFDFDKPADADKDNVYELLIQAEDASGNKTSQRLFVDVANTVEYPAIEAVSASVDENSESGIIVTTVKILNAGDAGIEGFSIDSRDFRIDNAGNIFTLRKLDYEKKKFYYFSATAHSPNGLQAKDNVYIAVNDIKEILPDISDFTGNVFETARSGDLVGQMYVYPGADEEAVITLKGEGASDFTVSETGVITVSDSAVLSHEARKKYTLQAYATNSRGTSQTVDVTLRVNIWARLYGSFDDDYAESIATDDNNIYIASSVHSPYRGEDESEEGGASSYIQLSSLDTDGNIQWQKDLSPESRGDVTLACDQDGYLYVSGSLDENGNDFAYSDLFLMKFDSSGDHVWTKRYGTAENDTAATMQIHGESIYIAGSTDGSFDGYLNEGMSDIFLVKFDLQGTKQSAFQYGSRQYDRAESIAVDKTGHVYIAGSSYGAVDGQINYGGLDVLLTKVAADGTKVWTKELGSDKNDYAASISLDSAGDIYVSGTTYGKFESNDAFGSADIFLSKFTPAGVNQWNRLYGSAGSEYSAAMMIDSSDQVLLVGQSDGGMAGAKQLKINSDVLFSRIDVDGTMLWSQEIGTEQYNYAAGMAADTFGDIYIFGQTEDGWGSMPGYGSTTDTVLIKVPY